ncbi:MAG: hypothetical protein SGILL_001834 [Bacillariaceae sp.]
MLKGGYASYYDSSYRKGGDNKLQASSSSSQNEEMAENPQDGTGKKKNNDYNNLDQAEAGSDLVAVVGRPPLHQPPQQAEFNKIKDTITVTNEALSGDRQNSSPFGDGIQPETDPPDKKPEPDPPDGNEKGTLPTAETTATSVDETTRHMTNKKTPPTDESMTSGQKSFDADNLSQTGQLSASSTSLSSDKVQPTTTNSVNNVNEAAVHDTKPASSSSPPKNIRPDGRRTTNSPGAMATYLDNRHGKNHYLAFSLLNEPPDDRTLLLFRRQIVQLGWWSACLDRSALPSIPRILKACYAIHAYLQLNPANVALVYCENGRSRSGVVAACYLRFVGLVESTEEGFLYFLSRTNPTIPGETILRKIPPSLRRFFCQFDDILDHGGFLNRKPLLLKAIALQGLPVEDEPCIDIWDSSKRHVFSSHPEMWREDLYLQHQTHLFDGNNRPVSKWLDEDGFYKVNIMLDGDFLLLCRFGGDFAQETTVHDPTKILFRYANNTGCLSGGRPYELDYEQVDVTKRYVDHLEDDFLVTLLFQADWEIVEEGNDNDLPPSVLACLQSNSKKCLIRARNHNDNDALIEGWKVISKAHSARPARNDNAAFRRFCGGKGRDEMSERGIALALQMTNFDFPAAESLLETSSFCDMFLPKSEKPVRRDTETARRREMELKASDSILKIMDQASQSSTLATPDSDFLKLATNDVFNATLHVQPTRSRYLQTKVHAIISPQRGDIMGSFPSRAISASTGTPGPRSSTSAVPAISAPKMPYFSPDRRVIPQSCGAVARSESPRPEGAIGFPTYDVKARMVEDVQLQLPNTGIKSDLLMDLLDQSHTWTDTPDIESEEEEEDDEQPLPITTPETSVPIDTEPRGSMNQEAKEKKEKKWTDDQKVEAEQKRKEAHQRKLSQEKMKEENEAPPGAQGESLRNDPEYAKYFKMLKIGMQKEQVMHAMKKDGKDPAILDLDPDKPLQSQLPKPATDANGDAPPLKDDPLYAKYFKMIKMGMAREQVLHAMKRDEKDPAILDLDPSKSLLSQQKKDDEGPALRDDPEYSKYFKMLAMKLPMGAVKNALVRDGKDPSIMDLDPSKSVKSQMTTKPVVEDSGPALKDDPEYSKYFKMLAMKLPMGAVKNALVRDGKDPSVMDLDPNKSVESQLGGEKEEKDTGTPLKDDPEFAKYFKMEKMGLPRDAVKNALVRDGKDPAIMDFDPNKSVAFQMKQKKSAVVGKKSAKKKKKVRRKKIYWNPIDPGKIKEDSMWNIVRDYVAMDKLNYDQKEFEELFTESADPNDQKKKKAPQKEAKKLVQVIDPKRSMNGGIVLARMKTDHKKIAEYVDRMEHGKFDSTQLKALKEYLADADERRGLVAYMKKGEKSDEVRSQIFADLSETEKYMVTLMEVADADAKLETMLFRSVFTNRFRDITDGVKTLNSACDELRSSERLRKLMAVILTVVNQINTGGEGNKAMGFTLDALLKLNEAKAFDKKTSVLHYVVKLVKKNDEGLLAFESDVSHVIPAESVLLDSVAGDVKAIRDELDSVLDIVKQDADQLEEAGKIRKMSLAELVEQKTMVHHVGIVPQFNKISHLTGRTSMERFTLNAKVACEQAAESIENVQKKYAMVLGYFGEDEKMATGDFFGTLRRFMAEWKKAVEQVEKIERAQAKEKKRAAARAAKDAKRGRGKGAKLAKTTKEVTPGGIAALAAAAAASKRDAGKRKNFGPPSGGGIAALAAQAALKRKKEKAGNSKPSPGGIAALAAQAALKKSQAKSDSPEDVNGEPSRPPPPGGIATLAAEAALKKSQRKSQAEAQTTPTVGGIAALAAEAARKSEISQKETQNPPVGGIAALAAEAARKKRDVLESDARASPPIGGIAALAAEAARKKQTESHIEADKVIKPTESKPVIDEEDKSVDEKADEPKSPMRENSKFLSSLSSYRKNKSKSKSQRKLNVAEDASKTVEKQESTEALFGDVDDPSTSPKNTAFESNELPFDSGKNLTLQSTDNEAEPTDPPSLGSFLERRDSYDEVLRLNSDDSSVAIMAENFQKDAVQSPNGDAVWNEGNGVNTISDYMGWANLAIESCDTESVRGFEQSQSLDYQHDDDDSTIASAYYDDDASIVSGMGPNTPRGYADNSYFDDYDYNQSGNDYYQQPTDDSCQNDKNSSNNNKSSVTAKVAASILFNDSGSEATSVDHGQNDPNSTPYGADYGNPHAKDSEVIDMSLAFNDVGLDAGLSFGGDVGFDDGLGGFGGHHSMNDPGLNDLHQSSGGGFGSHQPFADNRSGSLSPKKEESEKKPASSKWFGGWGGKG